MADTRKSRLEQAAEKVERAIKNEGKMPSYHREVMAKHRKEWPTLWRALDELLREVKGGR